MTGHLDEALLQLLRAALPGLLGGDAPVVQVTVVPAAFEIDAGATDVEAGQPRSDEAEDTLPFVAAQPAGPYMLTRPPDTSVRKVRLVTTAGDRLPLQEAEVRWDPADPRRFTLALHTGRDLAGVSGVRVLYGVTAVYAAVKYTQSLAIVFTSTDAAALERAQALALAVLALHRAALVSEGAGTDASDDYQARIAVKALHLLGGDAPADDRRRLLLRAGIELKGLRALVDGEGRPIVRLRSPGAGGDRAIDIQVQVDA